MDTLREGVRELRVREPQDIVRALEAVLSNVSLTGVIEPDASQGRVHFGDERHR